MSDSKHRRRRRTKIVATIGPASSTPEVLSELFTAGVDVFRLNFSHGGHDDHAARYHMIRELEGRTGRPIGILADVQGPKLRVGRFRGGHVELQKGHEFTLDLRPTPGDARRVQLPHPEIIEASGLGSHLLLDDGRVRLEVQRKLPDGLVTKVLTAGRLSDNKGVNVPGVLLPIPALTDKDRADVAFAMELGVDYVGLSFVQRYEDVMEAREIIGNRAWILSKIEKPQAMVDLDRIIAASDAVMVARGDLGVELPPEDVPLAQKRIVRLARQHAKPVIVATQMLESMISAPAPTRAEASDVATAVFDGADAVMLSAETAVGQYACEAVRIMDRIAARMERDDEWRRISTATRPEPERTSAGAISAAARQVAETIEAKAIAAFSHSGSTTLRTARERPDCPIIGFTPHVTTARRLALVWGVHPMPIHVTHTMTETVDQATTLARREGFAGRGDEIVVVAGVPFGRPGTTNALRVAKVGGLAAGKSREAD
ncbi:MAG TPA: pyruvate kinase [Caulobacteraceae bacterium]|nr:pyruvate kinase [Caulobacteraceae bacterium]